MASGSAPLSTRFTLPVMVADWRMRLEQAGDNSAIAAVVTAAFEGAAVADLLEGMRGDHSWLGLSFVAEAVGSPGQVLAHVAYTRGWIDAPDRLIDVLILSPLSVRPGFQRRGLGRDLVHRSIEVLSRTRPEPVIFLEGDPAYYARLGFRSAQQLRFTKPSVRIPDTAFQAWLLPTYTEGLTGALVYPDIFWRHDAVGLRN
jgi:putative acetyltransferase